MFSDSGRVSVCARSRGRSRGRGAGASSASVAKRSASTAGVRCCSSISVNKGIGVAGGRSVANDVSRNTANTRSLTVNTSSAGNSVVGDDSAGGSSSVKSKRKRPGVGSASDGHKASSAVRDISNAGIVATNGAVLTTYV